MWAWWCATALHATVDARGRVELRSEAVDVCSVADPAFTTMGCGACAADCNAHATAALAGTTQSVSGLADCVAACAKDSACASVSIGSANGGFECTKHSDVPVGAVCGDACTKDGCRERVCLVHTAQLTSKASLRELGPGACWSTAEELSVLDTTPFQSEADCHDSCARDPACFSATAGKRWHISPDGGRELHAESAEPFCQRYKTLANQAVTNEFEGVTRLRKHACAGSSPDCGEECSCVVRAENLTCYSKFAGVDRGEGICQAGRPLGKYTLQLPLGGNLLTTADCQAECRKLAHCRGGTFAKFGGGSAPSFCRLYNGTDVPLGLWGSRKQLALAGCDACSESQRAACKDGDFAFVEDATCFPPCKECLDQYTSQCFAMP